MNCPRRLLTIPSSKLQNWLADQSIAYSRVVHYQGNVAPRKNLENIIRSMRHWPTDAIFVLVGRGSDTFISSLKKLATELAVETRLVFTGRVNYTDLFAGTAGASVGVTLLESRYPNWRWAAGASNKRFEYLALGIPQVTNPGPGIKELFTNEGVALSVDPSKPDDIGTAINKYLSNSELSSQASIRARRLHLSEYNYERQFEPVMGWIDAQITSGKHYGSRLPP
ncbi:MAG TPA: glycosyltransferase [Chthoniobacterales bacterium]